MYSNGDAAAAADADAPCGQTLTQGVLARQIACEVINLIQVNSNSKNYLNAENLNEVQSCCFDKKVLENWQSVIKIFHMNNLMYQNI